MCMYLYRSRIAIEYVRKVQYLNTKPKQMMAYPIFESGRIVLKYTLYIVQNRRRLTEWLICSRLTGSDMFILRIHTGHDKNKLIGLY